MSKNMPGEDRLLAARQMMDKAITEMFAVIGRVPPLAIITVEPGDTLWHMAEKYCNDGQRWRELYLLNFEVVTRAEALHGADQGPDLIYPGTQLRVLEI